MVKKKGINSLDSELNIGHTKIDIERLKRRGFSESIFCLGKSLSQIEDIAESVSTINQSILFTKMSISQMRSAKKYLPKLIYDSDAKLGIHTVKHSERKIGSVGILTAGTSDFPVAQESYLSAKHFGMDSELITDVGVAGLHRLLSRLDIFSAKDCLIVVAGMDGALPSVVSGLVSVPVIAVPTSVGYGASFSGLGALLTMLNSCSPGVAVVNIDNGFGAAYLAAQILSRNQKR
jgi:NCAIR mutase (PurE)-related protein